MPIGTTYKFLPYSRKAGGDTMLIRFVRTSTGWDVTGSLHSVDCDKAGNPGLFRELDLDTISYPCDLGGWLEHLWAQDATGSFSDQEIQDAFTALGSWVSTSERTAPNTGAWQGYKP